MSSGCVQGEVEQISLMKAKGETKEDTGLLEYLEDIIGTDQYVDAIEEAAAELEQLNEKRQTYVARAKTAGARFRGCALARACAPAERTLPCLPALQAST
jgi:structural maintenance of chromosome 4